MINNVALTGRITKDIELTYTQGGMALAKFTLAVNRSFKKEGQPDADFIRCVAFDKRAEIVANHLRKGSLVGIEGRIQTGSYDDKDGKRVYTTDVVVNNVAFLEPRDSAPTQQQPAQQQYQQAPQQQHQQRQYQQQQYQPYGQAPMDKDLPF